MTHFQTVVASTITLTTKRNSKRFKSLLKLSCKVNARTSVKLTLSERFVRSSPAFGCSTERPSKILRLSRDRLSQIQRLSDNFRKSKNGPPPHRVLPNRRLKNRRSQSRLKARVKAKKKVPKVNKMEKPPSMKLSSRSVKLLTNSRLSSSLR